MLATSIFQQFVLPVATIEIVFYKRNIFIHHDFFLPAMPTVSRVAVAKLVGVYLRHDVNFTEHVKSVVSAGNQIRLSVSSDSTTEKLGFGIFNTVVLNKISYALPVYFGHWTESQ